MSYTRTALDLIARIFTTRVNVDRRRGYDDAADVARVAPLAIISDDLKYFEGTAAVAETTLSLVTSYYLKALPLSQEIGGAEVTKTLRRMNPNPRMNLGTKSLAKTGKEVLGGIKTLGTLGLLDDTRSPDFMGLQGDNLGMEGKVAEINASAMKDTELSAVEKEIKVKIKIENGSEVEVPITIALNVHYVTRLVATDLLSGITVKDSFTERYYDWKAGVISAADFIFALDMLKRKKQTLIQDKTGILAEIQERREAGWAVVAADGFHLGEATNVAIISESTARDVAVRHRGKLTSAGVRDKIFSDLSLMVLAIVDREDEYVTFYYRNMAASSTYPIKSLIKKNARGGPDIAEVLKAMNSGNKAMF